MDLNLILTCKECEHSCWNHKNFDTPCKLNPNIKEVDLNATMTGEGCPFDRVVKEMKAFVKRNYKMDEVKKKELNSVSKETKKMIKDFDDEITLMRQVQLLSLIKSQTNTLLKFLDESGILK